MSRLTMYMYTYVHVEYNLLGHSLYTCLYTVSVVPTFFLVDAEREREEETEGAVVSSSVLQRAGSALQSAPPLLQGEERANGAAVDEDEEEGVCGRLARGSMGLNLQMEWFIVCKVVCDCGRC